MHVSLCWVLLSSLEASAVDKMWVVFGVDAGLLLKGLLDWLVERQCRL